MSELAATVEPLAVPGKCSRWAVRLGRFTLKFSRCPGAQLLFGYWRRQALARGAQRIVIHSRSGIKIDGLYIPAGVRRKWSNRPAWTDGRRDYLPAKPFAELHPQIPIVMVHGWLQTKELHLPRAFAWARQGHPVYLFDLRGHGCTQGSVCTYSQRERQDLKEILDELESHGRLPGGKVLTYGHSLGAAVVLQHAALDERVQAVIACAPFASFPQAIDSYRRCYRAPLSKAWVESGFLQAARELGFDLTDTLTQRAVEHLRCPMLIVVGKRDRNVPMREHAQKLYEAKTHGARAFHVVERANHFSLHYRHWPTMETAIQQFLSTHGQVASASPVE